MVQCTLSVLSTSFQRDVDRIEPALSPKTRHHDASTSTRRLRGQMGSPVDALARSGRTNRRRVVSRQCACGERACAERALDTGRKALSNNETGFG